MQKEAYNHTPEEVKKLCEVYRHTSSRAKKWKKRLYAHQTPGLELQLDTKYSYEHKQGKEFTASTVKTYSEDNDIQHRLNTPYCPEENGKIERFHRTLNEKCFRFGFKPSDPLETMQYWLSLFLQY